MMKQKRINFLTVRYTEYAESVGGYYTVDAVHMARDGNGTTVVSVDCNTKSQALELSKRLLGAACFLPAE